MKVTKELFLDICKNEREWDECWDNLENILKCSSLYECKLYENHARQFDILIGQIIEKEENRDLFYQFFYEGPNLYSSYDKENPLNLYDESDNIIASIGSFEQLYDYINDDEQYRCY